MTIATTETRPATPSGLLRGAIWIALAILQAVVISWLFEIPYWFSSWGNPFSYVRRIAVWGLISGAAFGLIVWPRRHELMAAWQREQEAHAWTPALALNVTLFILLTLATAGITAYSAELTEPPVVALTLYGILLVATGISLLRVDIPLSGALRILAGFRNEAAVAAAFGLGVEMLGALAIHGWEHMAAATLAVSKTILELYEPSVVVDAVERTITLGRFTVIITSACSGYEGIALVSSFLCVYFWIFRDSLSFPRAFILLPIGIAAIWLLNCVRIALLASLGAHVSPQIAVQGFHSQAGWIAFLAATLGIMALARHWSFIAVRQPRDAALPASEPRAASDRAMLAHIVPFMAMMMASIVISASAPYDHLLYGLKVAAVLAAVWAFRDVYRGWTWSIPVEGVAAGLAVGAVWIATDPGSAEPSPLAEWLATIGPAAAALWILVRAIGSVIAVPIAEELAFRGLLCRWLVARDFERVPYEAVSVLAIVASSLLFGLMHERWIAGALAGVVFAMLMVRSGGLKSPIAAHMAANGLIMAWALVFRQWTLL